MANRRGVFVGGYLPPRMKHYLEARARSERKTVSRVLADIINAAMGADRARPLPLPARPGTPMVGKKRPGCDFAWCGVKKLCAACGEKAATG